MLLDVLLSSFFQVRVLSCDDGKGMSEDVVRKILSQTRVSANKTFGQWGRFTIL